MCNGSVLPAPWLPLLAAPCPLQLPAFLAALRAQLAPEAPEAPEAPDRPETAPHQLVVRNTQLDLVDVSLRFSPPHSTTGATLHHAIHFYSAPDHDIAVIVLTPRAPVTKASDSPFCPRIQKLAYVWEPWQNAQQGDSIPTTTFDHAVPCGRVSIHYVPFPTSPPRSHSPPPPSFLAPRGAHPALASIASRLSSKPKRSSPLASTSSISSISVNDHNDLRPPPPNKSDDKSDNRFEGKDDRPSLYQHCEEHLGRLFRQAQDETLSSDPWAILSILSIPLSLSSKAPVSTHDSLLHYDAKVLDFSALYLILKERHRHLAKKKSSFPLDQLRTSSRSLSHHPDDSALPDDLAEWGQHDIAAAAFLMIMWRDLYPRGDNDKDGACGGGAGGPRRAWDTWGRPKAGFVDLGCGNGLLVHILASEGYQGVGYDLRPRQAWSSYPSSTQARLHSLEIDPPAWFPATLDEWKSGGWSGSVVRDDSFLIGNHADQLTPWIPLFSLLPKTPIPFLSFPCCLHLFSPSAMFTDCTYDPPVHPHSPQEWLPLVNGEQEKHGVYSSYVKWLGWVGLKAGWEWEVESVRGEGVKGYGIVGNRRWTESADQDDASRAWALEQVQSVRKGATKTNADK
ncbi:hypothetical protein L198_00184 [Cryptococcus wingfieldii CBS 7118]|uniref:tRNA (uracil-O(2)-)-methyltransferase n=1 Tax=Cryptococcus wingfieldii CBS 7118 TaxID=1295528 RepID=A0A1E3K5K2_9TREE|nr:hypothetical protein L198_00184 [Cryptococcus wingfieldii CBS 7118]ODO08454.1 hypothetical protein L198_00184 [Cryptococcus wingfieldii CBS 7118]